MHKLQNAVSASGAIAALWLTVLIWGVNLIWLSQDTRPPVWDMAMHQSYALNYLQPPAGPGRLIPPADRSGTYPPFVHLVIAFLFSILHPGPHVAVLANVPATFLLLWAVYELASDMSGAGAARWAAALTALTPYLFWMSRETVLDYWLSAWVAASLALLCRSRGFESRRASLLLGCAMAFGLLTKWIFAGFLAFPLVYTSIRHRVWKQSDRGINLLDSLLLAGGLAGVWYVPNIQKLIRYFSENMQIGAREGEPPVLSFQSFIYYLRLLEGYQFFAVLFVLVLLGGCFAWRKRLLSDPWFFLAATGGGWLAMTLLRTKDPRFTMPLLGLLVILPAAWLQSWSKSWRYRAARLALIALLLTQLFAINFGLRWMPPEVVLANGYQGSLRWNWNLYLQQYFGILGPPRREDWRQEAILGRLAADAARRRVPMTLALVPDLPRFNAANFQLYARLGHLRTRVDHLQDARGGLRSFDGFNYVLMSEGDQGMSWSTTAGRDLNKVIVDEHEVFRLIELYTLPNGASVRLYFIQRPDAG